MSFTTAACSTKVRTRRPTSATYDIYTVYPDGSGVEAYRCDHGVSRHAARQLASRDIVFTTNKGFARFTSALATQVDPVPVARRRIRRTHGGMRAPGEWLVSFRPNARTPYAIYSLNPVSGALAKMPDGQGVEPMMLAAREVPLRFPSGLHDWAGANLLCLNAYTSKTNIAEGAIGSVRLYTQRAEGQSALLGETAVESDGSFFLHVPSEQPLRMELRDRSGRVIEAEHGWFWMRRGEQRVCVGCHAGPERAPENAVPKVLLRKDVPVAWQGVRNEAILWGRLSACGAFSGRPRRVAPSNRHGHRRQPTRRRPSVSRTPPPLPASSSPTASARASWVRCSKAPARAASGSTTTTMAYRISTWRSGGRWATRCILTRCANRAGPAAAQPSLSQQRQRQIHGRHGAGRRGRRTSSAWPPSPPISITTAMWTCWSPATATSRSIATKATAPSRMSPPKPA